MKKIQVLGPGCPKCIELAKRTDEAAKASGLDYELEKVSELNKIMAFGVFMTPAFAAPRAVRWGSAGPPWWGAPSPACGSMGKGLGGN
jgi:small redox-active disulfide protein 2